MKFPTLFKKTATGALQQWSIWTEANIIRTNYGQIGGSFQETLDVIKEGKNTGRANATTPEKQAELEAQAKWEIKQTKSGYVTNIAAAQAGESSDLVAGGILPMLAHRYAEHGHKIVYPCYVQPKLDGHRCIADIQDGTASLWSRTRKRITGVPHIARVFENLGVVEATFDGELYKHDYRDRFEELTSFIRQQTPKPGHEVIEYWIYDAPGVEGSFEARYNTLRGFFKQCADRTSNATVNALKLVETLRVADEAELMSAFEHFLSEGYEGAIARNAQGCYENKRSYNIQKIKTMKDAEFKIIGIEEGRGRLAGHAIFVCETKAGSRFTVKLMGALENLQKFWRQPELAIGKQLTVKFQNLTADGIPRFPVGVRLREDI